MPKLTAADEYFYHQIPEPLPNVITRHDHWRESLFFVLHPRDQLGDVVILTLAQYPKRETLDSFQLGKVGDDFIMAIHDRPYDGDPLPATSKDHTVAGQAIRIWRSRHRIPGISHGIGALLIGEDKHNIRFAGHLRCSIY